jgi:hypothetical protein
MAPEFPKFKPVELGERDFIHEILWRYQPETSELTFANLFTWSHHYQFRWSVYKDWLCIICSMDDDRGIFAFPPVGPSSRLEVVRVLLGWLKEKEGENAARIERADRRLAVELENSPCFIVEPVRSQFDYIYRTEDMITLSGRKYHGKRNHINKFLSRYSFVYQNLDGRHVKECLELVEKWCKLKRCQDDLSIIREVEAVRSALVNFEPLRLAGGVILIGDRVEGFAIGELINETTAVVHIEKGNSEIPGIYAVINQQFCENRWKGVPYLSLEMDLGEPNLRKAKQSYFPDHLVEKFNIRLK